MGDKPVRRLAPDNVKLLAERSNMVQQRSDRLDMGSIFRLGLAVSLLFSAACAVAAEWRTVGVNEKVKVEMDDATLVRTGNVAKAWDREVYFKPEQARPGDFYFGSVKTLSRYGCDVRLTEMLVQVYYADDGTEIKRIIGGGDDGRPGHVVPDSVGEWKFNYACSHKLAGESKIKPKAKKRTPAKAKVKKSAEKRASKPVPCEDQAAVGKKPVVRAKPVAPGVKAAPTQSAPAPVRAPLRAQPAPVGVSTESATTLETLTKSPPGKKP